jgi:hypothetical protein
VKLQFPAVWDTETGEITLKLPKPPPPKPIKAGPKVADAKPQRPN